MNNEEAKKILREVKPTIIEGWIGEKRFINKFISQEYKYTDSWWIANYTNKEEEKIDVFFCFTEDLNEIDRKVIEKIKKKNMEMWQVKTKNLYIYILAK